MSLTETNCAEITIAGIARIDRVVGVFEVWSDGTLPFAKFKVKVLERAGGEFLGTPNVAVRNLTTGEPEYVSGLGRTSEDALTEAIKYFLEEARDHSPPTGLTETCFVWSAAEDF